MENPILFKVRREGGIPSIVDKFSSEWFQSLNIDTILDIGANIGQFTKTMTCLFPHARIYCFEPLPDCFESLKELSLSNSNIEALNIGVGAESGILPFEKNTFSASSSFLQMTGNLKQAFPFADNSNTVEVNIARLDDIVKDIKLGNRILVKIDVQGYEDKVLIGGESAIKQAAILVIETSFQSLYESQPLFKDIFLTLDKWGFYFVGMLDQLSDPKTGELLQGDAIFVNSRLD